MFPRSTFESKEMSFLCRSRQMDKMETERLALKEWAVALRALEQGVQTILLRKGGLSRNRAFSASLDLGSFSIQLSSIRILKS